MRRLSDIEWATFLQDVPVASLNLPPWGGVVEWSGLEILVYIGPSGEVFTTDISDRPDLIANIPRQYDPTASLWYYQLPQAIAVTAITEARAAGVAIESTIQEIATLVGQAAGAATKPLVENLTPILIGALVVLALLYLPGEK